MCKYFQVKMVPLIICTNIVNFYLCILREVCLLDMSILIPFSVFDINFDPFPSVLKNCHEEQTTDEGMSIFSLFSKKQCSTA